MLSTVPSACGFTDGVSAWTSSGTANQAHASQVGRRFNLTLPFQSVVIPLPDTHRRPRESSALYSSLTPIGLCLPQSHYLIRLACLRKSSSLEPDAAHRFCCEQRHCFRSDPSHGPLVRGSSQRRTLCPGQVRDRHRRS